jgi:hypothetical protein
MTAFYLPLDEIADGWVMKFDNISDCHKSRFLVTGESVTGKLSL